MLLVFSLSLRVKLSHTADYSTPSSALHIREFVVGICLENLPWLFAAKICRRNLPWKFPVPVCREFSVFVRKFFFALTKRNTANKENLTNKKGLLTCKKGLLPYKQDYVNKSCLYGSKPFLHVSKSFLFMRFSLLVVFLFVIALN